MAKGSQKTYGGWEPRVCRDCGRKLTLNDAAMAHMDDVTGGVWSLCHGCLVAGSVPLADPAGIVSNVPGRAVA